MRAARQTQADRAHKGAARQKSVGRPSLQQDMVLSGRSWVDRGQGVERGLLHVRRGATDPHLRWSTATHAFVKGQARLGGGPTVNRHRVDRGVDPTVPDKRCIGAGGGSRFAHSPMPFSHTTCPGHQDKLGPLLYNSALRRTCMPRPF